MQSVGPGKLLMHISLQLSCPHRQAPLFQLSCPCWQVQLCNPIHPIHWISGVVFRQSPRSEVQSPMPDAPAIVEWDP
eukprot:1145270-Pelagomonas_calceolata.AAC.2